MPVLIALGAVLVLLLVEQASGNNVLDVTDYSTSQPDPPTVPIYGWGLDSVPSTAAGKVNTTRLVDFANAVVPTEGKPGDLNFTNNNPGNLKYAGQPGAIGADARGFAVFPTFDAGFQALQNQLAKNARDYPNFTLLQWAKHYLGMDPNSPIAVTAEGNALTKAQSVAQSLGVSVNTTLSQLLGV